MISSFGAILAWKSDDDDAAADTDADAEDNYDDDRKSDPYMSPSYAGDTTKSKRNIGFLESMIIMTQWTIRSMSHMYVEH